MNSINRATLIGNVGQEPNIGTTSNNQEVASFSIATTESWTDKSTLEKKIKTEWHKIVVFNNNLVSVIKSYLRKGSKVYIEGALRTRKWFDKKTNSDKYTTEIVLEKYSGKLVMLDGKNTSSIDNVDETSKQPHKAPDATELANELDDDDVPF